MDGSCDDDSKDNAAAISIKSDEPEIFVRRAADSDWGVSMRTLASRTRKAAAAPKRYFINAAVCSRANSTAFSRLIVAGFAPGSSCT